MKTISLWQPFASLVSLGLKRIETRSWAPSRLWPDWKGNQLAIHASKGGYCQRDLEMICASEPFKSSLAQQGICGPAQLPRGMIVCTCILADCQQMVLPHGRAMVLANDQVVRDTEFEFGEYAVGRYAWLLEDVKPIEPVPFKGGQGFFQVPDDLLGRGAELAKEYERAAMPLFAGMT